MIDRLLLPVSGKEVPVPAFDSSTPAGEGFSAQLDDLLALLAGTATVDAPEIPGTPPPEQPHTSDKPPLPQLMLPDSNVVNGADEPNAENLAPETSDGKPVVLNLPPPTPAPDTSNGKPVVLNLQAPTPAPETSEGKPVVLNVEFPTPAPDVEKAVQPRTLNEQQSIKPDVEPLAPRLPSEEQSKETAGAVCDRSYFPDFNEQRAVIDRPYRRPSNETKAIPTRPEITQEVESRKPATPQVVDTSKTNLITTDVIASIQQPFLSTVMIALQQPIQPLRPLADLQKPQIEAPTVPQPLRPLSEQPTPLPVPLNVDEIDQVVPAAFTSHVLGHGQLSLNSSSDLPDDLPSDLADKLPSAMLGQVKKFFQMVNEHATAKPINVEPLEKMEAAITTDPIASFRQTQLPPAAVIAISKIVGDAKLQMRPKLPGATGEFGNMGTSMPMQESGTFSHSPITVEQAVAAQPIQIPDPPKLPLVRTVSMEVGEAESHVTIRIEERAGDMKLNLGVGNEALHRELSSSLGSLIHTLKQEDIQVSAAEVSKKSPIEKIRKMKEARNGHS